jgi:hypothetical protein
MSIIGSSLEAVRRDLKYMPTQTLIQYKQNPAKNAVDGIPMDMLAGLELSRRAQMQNEMSAAGAQGAANMPTVTDAAAQQLTGQQPQQPPPPMPQGAPQQPMPQQRPPQPMPQPQPQQPQPQQPQPQQPPPQMQQQGGLPTIKKAGGGEINGGRVVNSLEDFQKFVSGGYAGGGVIAFANRGEVPNAYSGYENILGSDSTEDPEGYSPSIDPRAYPRKAKKEVEKKAAAKEESKSADVALPPPMKAELSAQERILAAINKSMESKGGGFGGISVPKITVPPPPDISAGIQALRTSAEATPDENAAIRAQKDFAAGLKTRPSPYMTPEELAAEEKKQLDKYQALYNPLNQETQKIIDERKAALEYRRGQRLSEAGMQLGLGMLAGRGRFGRIVGDSGKEALGTYQKSQALDDAQAERIQDMHLKQQQALVAQQAGNMDLARRLSREAQADKVAIDSYKFGMEKEGLAALNEAGKLSAKVNDRKFDVDKYALNIENVIKNQQLGYNVDKQLAEMKMDLSLRLAQASAANDIADMRNLTQLYTMISKVEAAKVPTMGDVERADKTVKDQFADPASMGVQAFVASRNNPELANKYAQALRDSQSSTQSIAQPANLFLYNVQQAAKEQGIKARLSGTRTSGESSSGVRDYDDVRKQLGG